jgi:AIPR protein
LEWSSTSRQLRKPEELSILHAALKDEHAAGFVPDDKWFRAFIAKLIIFRTAQDIVKRQKFAAYQAIISAYTVASLAQRYGQAFDLALVWSRQAISSQLASLIREWAIAIDKALRRTAGSRMPSEWAKKLECWDTIRETKLDALDAIPPELNAPAAVEDVEAREPPEAIETNEAEKDIGSLILRIRPLFAREEVLRREELITKLAEIIGFSVSDPKVQQETESVIQAAIRRGILRDGGHEVSLVARNISEYPREVLKDQFLASLNGSNWTERSESIPRFARWLGFRRTGPNIEDAARSAINSLIRGDRLEKMGSQIRRT